MLKAKTSITMTDKKLDAFDEVEKVPTIGFFGGLVPVTLKEEFDIALKQLRLSKVAWLEYEMKRLIDRASKSNLGGLK